ncbi:MAG: S8 family serine peptidase, partial [Polaribacter sp.]|nr:S8 family serine peptidase [Polaribacter sp.]
DGIDTDENGFEDDLVGWDFTQNDNKPNKPLDEHRHGTHVAGILGAVGDNADPDNADPDKRFDGGVSGVNWQTSIMPLRFLDEDNRGDVSSAVEAINYTTMMRTRPENAVNVRVSNNSWGSSGAFSQTLFDAVAGNLEADILFVAAAGNGDVLGRGVNNDDVPFFPANLDLENVISVGAINDRGALASFSNFGATTVDIVAPGVGIVSTDLGRNFISRSGTSMATPFVSGVAALVFDQFPEATAAEVRDAILSGAVESASLDGFIEGSRSLNALGALTASTFAPVPELVTVPGISGGDAGVVITVTYDDPNTNDAFGVDSTTFDIRDVQLTREGFSETLLAPVSISNTTMMEGLPTVEYQFDAPGGTWDATENGTWRVSLREGEIRDNRDKNPLFSAPRELGTFTVSIADPNVIFVNTTIDSVDIDPMDGRADDGATTVDGDIRVSLRAAIMHASTTDAATTIVVPDGTYVLTLPGANENGAATGDLDLTSSHGVTVIGGGVFQTVIDGQQLDRVFDVAVGASATLTGLTVQNGRSSQGGGINNLGTLTVDGVLVRDNQAETAGGGIFSSGMLSVLNSSVEDNQVASQFFAIGGGGLAINGDPANASHQTTITDSSFVGNTSSLSGGGLLAVDTALTLQGVTLAANVAAGGDGGGLLIRRSTLDRQSTPDRPSTLDRVTITDNSAGTVARGGGLFIDTPQGQVTLQNTVLAGNTAGFDADLSGQFLSDGTNLISQLSTDGLNLRRLVSGAADFDQIGTPQSPLAPDLSALERPDGLVQQVRSPEGNGLASNEDLTGLADLSLTPGLTITYSTAELEPNNSRGQAMRLDDRGWSLAENADIATSITIPHVTIPGTGDGTFDFYSFTVEQAGSTAVFDIDNGGLAPGDVFDTELFLFDSSDTLLASTSGENVPVDTGSSSGDDARIEHTFVAAGYYTIAVGAFNSSHDGAGGLTGTAPPAGKRYVLHVSVQNHELAQTTYNPTSAVNTLFPIAGAANGEEFVFSATEGTALFDGVRTFAAGDRPVSVVLG